MRRRRDENGMASIELVGIIPVAFLICGAIIQLFLIGYAAVSAESAARLAARECSKGLSDGYVRDEAARNVPKFFEPNVSTGCRVPTGNGEPGVVAAGIRPDEVSVRVRVKVPFLGIGVPDLDMTVERYAVMPLIDD